jgi:hypothetical protein
MVSGSLHMVQLLSISDGPSDFIHAITRNRVGIHAQWGQPEKYH